MGKRNSEPPNPDKPTVQGYSPELGTRLSRVVAMIGTAMQAASVAGISDESLTNWVRGRSRPNFFGMQALARAAGVRLEWLATGEGPMRAEAAPAPDPAMASPPVTGAESLVPPLATDAALMGYLIDGILKVYKDMHQAIPPRHLAELAARLHDEIIAAGIDPDPGARRAAATVLLGRLRQELSAAAADPASTKRLA